MAKTVTIQSAPTGVVTVRVGDQVFAVGEPTRDVSDDTIEQLKAMPGVDVHIAGGKRDTTKQNEEE